MSGPEDDAAAPTVVAFGASTLAERDTRELDRFGPGSSIGRYVLKSRIGAGAMGVVWSARDPQLDRDVAIKLVRPALASEESSSRLLREARAMAKLSHRSVITVHDAGEVDGTLFLAMELVRGTTLGHLLRTRDAAALADWRRWLALMLDAGRGLAEAHRNGVLHRDFKPDNVLVDESGRVCVGDFGLAALGDRVSSRRSEPAVAIDSDSASDLTSTGALLGTPVYMSPQQLGGEPIDARADQFGFCVALYEALYGARPFIVETGGIAAIYNLLAKIVVGVPEPPAGSQVPRPIYDCIRRGLSVQPDDRWPDMDSVLAALERIAKPRSSTVSSRPRRSRRYLAAGALAVATLAIAIIIAARGSEPAPVLTKLFGTPLNTKLALSADGRRVALAGDVLEVRTLDGSEEPRTAPLPLDVAGLRLHVLFVDVDDEQVRFSVDGYHQRWRWRYRENKGPVVEVDDIGGTWRGTTIAGELVRVGDRGLGIVGRDRSIDSWGVHIVDIAAVSPDGRRVAYIEGGRFTGTIVVRDVTTGRVIRSTVLEEPVSLAWLGSTTLVYGTSSLIQPRISRVEVTAGFGTPEVIYAETAGWFSDLAVGGGQLYLVRMLPTPRGRIVERPSRRRIELDSVSLGLGWDASDQMVTWNASNKQVSPHAGKAAQLGAEPINATLAGTTLIATLRALGGRKSVAVSLSDGTVLWEHLDLRTIAVRCAGDRLPPCFAVRNISEDLDRLVTLDPTSGALGTAILYEARRIDDLAVSTDGARLVITESTGLREMSPTGALIKEHLIVDSNRSAMLSVRSVAYDPKGGFLLAGTTGRNTYQVGRFRDGAYESIDEVRDKILWLVRPSSDGSSIVFIARGYEPELFRFGPP